MLHEPLSFYLFPAVLLLILSSSLSLSLAFNSTGKGVKGDSQKGEGERCWDAREKEREGGGEAGTDMKAARRCWWWKVKSRESIAMRDWQGGRDKRGKKGTEEQRVRANKPQKGLLGRRTSSEAPAVGRGGGVSLHTHIHQNTWQIGRVPASYTCLAAFPVRDINIYQIFHFSEENPR